MADEQLLQQLKGKYGSVISAAPQLGVQLQNVHIENGKLLIRGKVPNENVKNEIWNRIKAIDRSYSDLVADISVDSSLRQPAVAGEGSRNRSAGQGSGWSTTGDPMNLGDLDLSKILDRYADREDVDGSDDDFDQVAQNAPPAVMSQGVAEAFRSDRTPPFPNMLGQMFGQSDPNTRAGILNQLIAGVGPAILAGALGRAGNPGSMAGGGLGRILGDLLGGSGGGFGQTSVPQITPEQASQVPAEAVEELAREAQQKDSDIISRVSDFAAQNPTLVKGLGAVAVGIALRHLAGQKRGGFF